MLQRIKEIQHLAKEDQNTIIRMTSGTGRSQGRRARGGQFALHHLTLRLAKGIDQ